MKLNFIGKVFISFRQKRDIFIDNENFKKIHYKYWLRSHYWVDDLSTHESVFYSTDFIFS